MGPIIDFLHKARAYAEQMGLGNEEGALARAIHGLQSIVHLDWDHINRWNPQTGEVADKQDPNPDGSVTLLGAGTMPGVSKDSLYNPVKLSSHSPTFPSDLPDPMRGGMAHKRVGDADSVEVAGDKEAGVGIDPAKANPDEVAAESNYHVAPLAPPAPEKGVTTTETEERPVGAGPDAPRSEFATGTQGTRPDSRSPFAPSYTSRSNAAKEGVDLPIPVEETTTTR